MQSLQRLKVASSCRHVSTNRQTHYLVPLTDVNVLRIGGSDALKFIQGLVTQDVRPMGSPDEQQFATGVASACYMAWLSSKGRVLFDTIMTRDPRATHPNSFLLQCKAEVAEQLLKHIKGYRLRAKVEVEQDTSLQVLAGVRLPSDQASPPSQSTTAAPVQPLPAQSEWHTTARDLKALQLLQDPRAAELGVRFVLPTDTTGAAATPQPTTEALCMYNSFLMLNGIPQLAGGGLEASRSLPLEANIEHLHGCSFNKGCYLGQELTARSHFRGLIRKRLFPVLLSASFPSLPSSPSSPSPSSSSSSQPLQRLSHWQAQSPNRLLPTSLTDMDPLDPLPSLSDVLVADQKDKKAGRLVAVLGQGPLAGRLGLALLYLYRACASQQSPLFVRDGDRTVYLQPYLPNWLPDLGAEVAASQQE
eukprot:g46611.t1